jgi:hypothetical protein
MGFLRRLLGGTAHPDQPDAAPVDSADVGPDDVDADEREYEHELLEGERDRLDELAQRQLRFAKHAWQPPAQGGERRADDHGARADRR